MGVIFIIICLVIYLSFLWHEKTARIRKVIANIPHRKELPIVGNAHEFGTTTDELFKNFLKIVSECGPVASVWFGPEAFIVLSSVEDIEMVMASHKMITKSFCYEFLKPWVGVTLLTATGETWSKRRKLMTPAFHFRILEQFMDVFNKNCSVLINKVKAEVGRPGFNAHDYIDLFAIDVISESSMGVSINAQNAESAEFLSAMHHLSSAFIYRVTKPWLHPEILFRLSPTGRKFYSDLKIVHNFVEEVIQSRKKIRLEKKEELSRSTDELEAVGVRKRKAMLDILLDYAESGSGLTDEDIKFEVSTFMSAGLDTGTSAIVFTLYALMKHQDVQEKLASELKEIFEGSDRAATYNDIHNMKYLDKIIKEVLRIWPAVPYVSRSVTEDFTLKSGYTLPKGSSVILLMYKLHHDPELYPNPEVFDPERFSIENSLGRHPFAYLPFSAGLRNCIGQKYAILEVKSIISAIVRNYKILPPIGLPDINLTAEVVLRSTTGINIRLVDR